MSVTTPELPIGFAHRGGAQQRHLQNTLAAFVQSMALGATAIESDVGLTADGVAVLIHPGIVARLRRPVSSLRRDQLPANVPTLEELYRECGPNLDVALDMAAPAAVEQVVATARAHGDPTRLWLTYWRVDALARWRQRYSDVRLVFPSLVLRTASAQRRCALLRDAGVDALNLHHRTCTAQRVALVHGSGLLLFGWGARGGAAAARTLRNGADGVFCDDTIAMVGVVTAERARRQRLLSEAR
ncbi:MAG: glycerophosphodiester phosphodiesterase [Candidatus Dormibacteraeota bacterium]|nr:glycerophosphodiester phosphodiesterase [Candidatus Dormibacteraeota bacterium]